MTSSIDSEASHSVVAVEGDLDAVEVQDLREQVETLIGGNGSIIFDLSAVEFIDSSGIGLIVHTYRALNPSGRQVIVSGASDQPLELLRSTQLDRIVPFTESLEEARGRLN